MSRPKLPPGTTRQEQRKTRPELAEKKRLDDHRRNRKPPGAKARANQRQFLDLLMTGITGAEAVARMGYTYDMVLKWRKTDPLFVQDHERVKARLKGNYTPPRVPFSPEFRVTYLANDFEEPINPRHLLVLTDFVNKIGPGEFGLALMPPEHAKSTIGEDWLTQGIADDPETRSVVISKSQTEAIKRLETVQHRCEDRDFYPELIDTFGPFVGKPWSSTRMRVFRKTPRQRDYSLQALGIGGQIQGQRVDRGLLDDVEDDQNCGLYLDHARYIRQSVNTRLGRQGRGFQIGTRQDEMDVYRFLMDEGFYDHVLILPAVFEEDFDYEMSDGTVISWKAGETLWPERYSDEDYEKFRRKAGERGWQLIYQQQDEVSEGQAFPRKLIESCFNPGIRAKEVPDGCIACAGVDPAPSGFTAGVVFGVRPGSGFRTWVDARNEKGLVGEGGDKQAGIVNFILELVSDYGVRVLCLEENSAFTLLSTSLTLRTKLTEMDCTLVTVTSSGTGLRSGGEDIKDLAIKSLSTVFSNGVIEIPSADAESKMVFRHAIDQFVRWRSRDRKIIKDLVKAFQFCEHAARQVASGAYGIDMEIEGLEHLPPYLKERYREASV